MTATVEYLPERRTVVVKYAGTITPDVLGRQTQIGIGLLKQHGAYRVLVDCSEIDVIAVTTADVYEQPDVYHDQGVPTDTRIALVLPRNEIRTDLFKFYDDTSHNRGYNVELFENGEAAWAWLAQDPDDSLA